MPAPRLPPSKRQYVAQPVPGFVEFQHPKLVAEPPAGAAWLHELKLDGYRIQVRVARGRATVFTRRGHDWTTKLPELAEDAAELPDCILDGELCFLDANGKPTFSGLRAAIGRGQTAGLVYFAFDLLWRGQDDLRTFALKDRKAALARLLEAAPGPRIRLVEALPQNGPALLAAACRLGLEGIVSKRRDARYQPGRTDAWVKAKCRPGQEVVIGGWRQEKGRAFKALMVGVYDGDDFRYVGTVKAGFAGHPGLVQRLEAVEADRSPFTAGDKPARTAETRWARPELVANVEFAEWTGSGKLRQATFLGLRDDKDPREVRREEAGDVL
ncbi:non-homologous end-joining DNA ligase [Phenylobacterium sp.]|jgi:bifunctional non-homologous end joining protein LigD|uniref:non-homologous end-joining DNA ligase n=1 Tax=Phenylobacterium sp. TaxID=1871053 RepID=UPI002F92EFC7